MFSPIAVLTVVIVALASAGCGCAASPERKGEPAGTAPNQQEVWGASFELPEGWSGGENDGGGFEFTDGDVALMVGRHALQPGQSLQAFADERARALHDLAATDALDRNAQRLGAAETLVLSGRGQDGVAIRLLVARLGNDAGISLLMVGDAKSQGRVDAAWAKLMGSLRLPGG